MNKIKIGCFGAIAVTSGIKEYLNNNQIIYTPNDPTKNQIKIGKKPKNNTHTVLGLCTFKKTHATEPSNLEINFANGKLQKISYHPIRSIEIRGLIKRDRKIS